MKIYEFAVLDEFNSPKARILESADNMAIEQSGYMGFADGYKVIEVGEPEKLPSGEMRYHFEVHGEYEKSSSDDSGNKTPTSNRSDRGVAASPEL